MGEIWSSVKSLLTMAVVVAFVQGVLILFAKNWIDGRVKSYFDKAIEDYKFELKTREQAALIAEYSALAISLTETDNEEVYRRTNQLSWQIFLWLPADVYRKLGKGLQSTSGKKELVDAMVDVRKFLLGDRAGTLGADDIIVHAPNIGFKKPPE